MLKIICIDNEPQSVSTVDIYLQVNGQDVVALVSDDRDNSTPNVGTVASLQTGETVRVKAAESGCGVYGDNHAIFSGFLLSLV